MQRETAGWRTPFEKNSIVLFSIHPFNSLHALTGFHGTAEPAIPEFREPESLGS
jgi:hypothetical protein